MSRQWVLEKGILQLSDGSRLAHVSADEVYSSVIEERPCIAGVASGKHGAATEIQFSRYPAALRAILKDSPGGGFPFLDFTIVTQDNESFSVSSEVLKHDHIVVNGCWYPLAPEPMQEIRILLDAAGVDRANMRLKTLRGVLALKAKASLDGPVQDQSRSDSGAIIAGLVPGDAVPSGIHAKLYPYQSDGWRWLRFMIRENIGGLLADEMGLGKTLQIISAIRDRGNGESCRPALVVAPGSLLENWMREIRKFAPDLHTLKHHGSTRTGRPADLGNFDLVVTSYDTVVRDLSLFKMVEWTVVILDEAQNIKNPDALRTRSVKQLGRRVGLAMTGTPVENSLTDLWSILDFALPGYLGSKHDFEKEFEEGDVHDARRLEPLTSPLILRRLVTDVAKDLPERIDIPEVIELTEDEAVDYDRVRTEIAERYGRSATIVSLLKLRQFCAHPALLGVSGSTEFSKFARLRELMTEIVLNSEKAIVFTSFTEMADRIAAAVQNDMDAFSATLDGRLHVDERQPLIDRFSELKGPAVLVLNPKAGGSGLNITAATHVIHYNLEWNPALEDQASARAHRRGQTRPVTVRRLFCAGTVEEVVDERVERKRLVSGAAIVGVHGEDDDYADVMKALQRSPVGDR